MQADPVAMAEHHYKFNVAMSCGGCSGAIERVLKKLDGTAPLSLQCPALSLHHTPANLRPGVKSYDVSLPNQTADVVTEESVSYETVLEKIKKTGKTVNSGEADGVPMAI